MSWGGRAPRRRIAALAAALALALAAGCGGDDEGADSTVAAEPQTTEQVIVEASGGGFNPAQIYERSAPGVVTVVSIFGDSGDILSGGAGQGSGFIVSEGGEILTNAHVVAQGGSGNGGGEPKAARQVFVELADRNRYPAEVVGFDPDSDVALIKVQAGGTELKPLELSQRDNFAVGEPVAAIGSPFGNENSLAVGVVSAVSRSIPSLTSRYQVSNAIQVDAPINHGNSGGPLLDARGRVIGINAQIRSESGNAEGVGFAIPINSARRSMEQLVANGRVAYAYVGITTQDVTPALARKYELGAERGAIIEETVDDSPAARAGLRGSRRQEVFNGSPVPVGGDMIVSVGGRAVERADDVSRIVTEHLRPGQVVEVEVLRGGKGEPETVRLRLGERPVDP